MNLHAICRLLAATSASRVLQEHEWLVPAIQTLHILCLAIVFPAMVFLSLRLLGLAGRNRPLADSGRDLLPWVLPGLLGLLTSGVLLVVAEPARELPNPAFQVKMGMLLTALLLTGLQARAWRRAAPSGLAGAAQGPALVLRAGAVLTLILWTGIVVAGRWIAYMVEN